MNLGRRKFIAASAAAGAASMVNSASNAFTLPDPASKAKLKLSCQENVAPGKSLNEKLDFIEEHGFVGLEPGGGNLSNRVVEFQKALRGRNIKISAICAGFKGVIISEKESVRMEAMKSMKENAPIRHGSVELPWAKWSCRR